jgi:hypothetical protein
MVPRQARSSALAGATDNTTIKAATVPRMTVAIDRMRLSHYSPAVEVRRLVLGASPVLIREAHTDEFPKEGSR